jgi:hypothetical protein
MSSSKRFTTSVVGGSSVNNSVITGLAEDIQDLDTKIGDLNNVVLRKLDKVEPYTQAEVRELFSRLTLTNTSLSPVRKAVWCDDLNLFLAITVGGEFLVSIDGVQWDIRSTIGIGTTYNSIVYDDVHKTIVVADLSSVAVNEALPIHYSTNAGVSWTRTASITDIGFGIRNLYYIKDYAAIYGLSSVTGTFQYRLWRSMNGGITWANVPCLFQTGITINGKTGARTSLSMCYGNGRIILTSATVSPITSRVFQSSVIYSDDNGATWEYANPNKEIAILKRCSAVFNSSSNMAWDVEDVTGIQTGMRTVIRSNISANQANTLVNESPAGTLSFSVLYRLIGSSFRYIYMSSFYSSLTNLNPPALQNLDVLFEPFVYGMAYSPRLRLYVAACSHCNGEDTISIFEANNTRSVAVSTDGVEWEYVLTPKVRGSLGSKFYRNAVPEMILNDVYWSDAFNCFYIPLYPFGISTVISAPRVIYSFDGYNWETGLTMNSIQGYGHLMYSPRLGILTAVGFRDMSVISSHIGKQHGIYHFAGAAFSGVYTIPWTFIRGYGMNSSISVLRNGIYKLSLELIFSESINIEIGFFINDVIIARRYHSGMVGTYSGIVTLGTGNVLAVKINGTGTLEGKTVFSETSPAAILTVEEI